MKSQDSILVSRRLRKRFYLPIFRYEEQQLTTLLILFEVPQKKRGDPDCPRPHPAMLARAVYC